jgi:myo-inositol-1(or 4)-monophosphatase
MKIEPAALRVMEAIAEVGAEMMRSGLGGDLAVEDKGQPFDLVTRVDRDIEARARALAAQALPGYGFLGEEAGGQTARAGWLWVVDPLDGTSNYANGVLHAAVSVGLCHDGQAVAGIVADPFRGEKFVARGDGTAVAHDGRALAVRARDDFRGALVLLEMGGKAEAPAQALALFTRVRRSGGSCRVLGSAALSLAYVAAGRAAATLMARVGPWDVAAGLALLEAAGGIAVRAWDGEPYDVLAAGPLIAGSPAAVRRLRELVASP